MLCQGFVQLEWPIPFQGGPHCLRSQNQKSMIDAVWMFVAVGRIGFHIGSTKRCNAAPGQTLRIPSQSSAFYDKWVQVGSAHSTSFPAQISWGMIRQMTGRNSSRSREGVQKTSNLQQHCPTISKIQHTDILVHNNILTLDYAQT